MNNSKLLTEDDILGISIIFHGNTSEIESDVDSDVDLLLNLDNSGHASSRTSPNVESAGESSDSSFGDIGNLQRPSSTRAGPSSASAGPSSEELDHQVQVLDHQVQVLDHHN
ncbi:hypothetical protein M8J76_002702 [Diaphorina citri]|nr:hypothetical protein M8J75_011259 [Diaphorina citri]KAI5723193.1 hypothetical protein M8J76_002702 [Diaphorina citri]KAI5728773.1 hypothetical protein M8J77_020951 [Diaphorina citri]